MISKISWSGIVVAVGFGLPVVAQSQSVREVDEHLQGILALVERGEMSVAKQRLQRLPDEEIVVSIARFLESNPALPKTVKRFCFSTLLGRKAAASEEGYAALTRGLNDPDVSALAIGGLRSAPNARREETVRHFLPLLARRTDCESFGGMIYTFSRWGKAAKPALGQIERVFHDASCSDRVRSLAALAELQIGPVDRAFSEFKPEDARLVLGSLGRVGAETNGMFFSADEATRERIRAYVVNALFDEDEKTRAMALQDALLFVYGKEFILGNPQDGYRVNPDLVAAVERVAREDSEPQLREIARQLLETLPERLKKAVRRRNRSDG